MIGFILAAVLAGQVDGSGVRRLVEAHRGRKVVVSLWATWCDPCVEEFPWIMDLARARKDVVFLAVSIDDPDTQGALLDFVQSRKPPFPVYSRVPGKDDDFIDGVDPDWKGDVPTLLLFGKDGRRGAILEGTQSKEKLEKALEALGP